MEEPTTDAELIEYCRKSLQDAIDRVDWDAGDERALLESTGLPQEAVQVFERDLRYLGRIDLMLPERIAHRFPPWMLGTVLRHYVYQHKDGTPYVIHHPRRIELQKRGHLTLHAFVKRPDN